MLNLTDWSRLTDKQRKMMIIKNRKGLKHHDLIASLPYINAVINHTIYVKHTEKLPRYSVKAASEYLRWRSRAEDNSVLFKVNNNLSADLNHLLIRMFPELEGFFKVRKHTDIGS